MLRTRKRIEHAARSRRRRYGIDWYTGGRWYSLGRTWWTKRGARRACRRVLRDALCGTARVVVIVLSPVAARTSAGSPAAARPATWSGPGARRPVADRPAPAGGVG